MRTRRGPRGQFNSLYGTTTLRLRPELPYPPRGPRYERLVFAADGQLIVPLNEWYHLMKGLGAARMHETYLAVLRPWFGLLTSFYTVMRRGVFDPEDQRRLLRERTEAQLPQTTATATTAR